MMVINYPEPDFRIKNEGNKDFIFDSLRKKWLILTPEEWVRQNFIRFLVFEMNYPETLIAVEKEIQLGELKKRFDILVYDKEHKPWMLVECKSGEVKLEEKTFQQVLRYHISVPCSFLIITNGKNTFGWKKAGGELKELQEMPAWN
jgi:hypothetical protein